MMPCFCESFIKYCIICTLWKNVSNVKPSKVQLLDAPVVRAQN
jgi:hypothetical protein